MTEVKVSQADERKFPDRPVGEWWEELFAAVDEQRRVNCSLASAEGGDPPCWRALPDAYRATECSAGCATRAILGRLAPEQSIRHQAYEEAAKVMRGAFAVAVQAPELNMSNYDHDDVATLNNAMIEVWQILNAALTQAPASASPTPRGAGD